MLLLKKSYSIKQKFIQIIYNINKSDSIVLMFHQINNDKNQWDEEAYSITKDSFEKLINELKNKGYIFESTKKIGNRYKEGKKKVYLTFDDAYSDVYFNCYSFLKSNNIPFTIFMVTNFINQEKYLSEEMIFEMLNSGLCSLGSHSVNHLLFRGLTKKIENMEYLNSKRILEKKFNQKISDFAFPYGSVFAVSNKNKRNAFKHYSKVYSTIKSCIPKCYKNGMSIPRINVNEKNYKKIAD